MKEQLVSFETAKLAKEKGFNHMKANCFGDNMAYDLNSEGLVQAHNANTVIGYILAPTQSLLQKWLREEHNFNPTFARTSDNTWHFNPFGLITMDNLGEVLKFGEFNSYEEALEVALVEALNKEVE